MTNIITGSSKLSGGQRVSQYARRISSALVRWKQERELEAIPFDMRKDLGWPALDNQNTGKTVQ